MTRRGEGQERGSVISLLPEPQTPLKSPGPHGCCGGGGGDRVLGGAWGCGSTRPRAEWCGAVPGAVPVRLLSALAGAPGPPGQSGQGLEKFIFFKGHLVNVLGLWSSAVEA